ncbi:MAG: ABC transporter permease [Candidatus Thorarchaeota archaeon]|nr:MAG: ABC transporter permease [Candidatus Thorarchaeota archaeon]
MSELETYASKDLKRRPFRSTLVLFSLTSIVTSTTFIFLFGNVLLDVSVYSVTGTLSSSMGMFFSTFVWFILLLVFVLGAVVVSSTVSLEMVTRRRDIGLMKAVGTTLDTIFDFFMAQSVILLLASVILGLTFGTLFYVLGMVWLSSYLTNVQFTMDFPFIQIGLLAVIYIITGYYSSQKPIYDTVQESPSLALNPDVGSKVTRSGFLDSFGLAFRIAAKGTGRRVRGSRRTMLSLFLSFTIASLLWMGGGVVETTSRSYLMRSMGTNVIAVGNSTLLDQYYDAYSPYGAPLNYSFDFLESSHLINTSLLSEIEDLLGVTAVESRLVVFSDVQEGDGIIWNDLIEDYTRIGEGREDSALLVGVDWDSTISDWYFEGTRPNNTEVWIGGTLATVMFVDPLVQSLGFRGHSLSVSARAFDTLNGGMLAFMDKSILQNAVGVTGNNLALVQLDYYDETTITSIETLAASYGFDVFRQQPVLDENIEVIHTIWILLNPLALMALVSAFLGLLNYLLVSVFGRLRDFVIMRSIGAKPSFIARVMIAEGLELGMKSGLPALFVAALLSIYALIPEAAVPTLAYLPASIVTIFISMLVVILLASIPVYIFFMTRNDLRVSEFAS